MRSRAAERRQIHSLGREPQDTNEKILRKPRSGDRNIAVIPAAHGTDSCLSPPPGASFLFVVLSLGLTPQAMYLSPLRGSGSHDDFSSGLDTEGLGGSCILNLVSWISSTPRSCTGYRQHKRCARSVIAFELKLSTLSAREAAGDGEAETESWSTDCRFGAVKRSEYVTPLAARDPGSVVCHFDSKMVGV